MAWCRDLSSLDAIQELPLKMINLLRCDKLGTRDYRILEKISTLESVMTGDARRDHRILRATGRLRKRQGSTNR